MKPSRRDTTSNLLEENDAMNTIKYIAGMIIIFVASKFIGWDNIDKSILWAGYVVLTAAWVMPQNETIVER